MNITFVMADGTRMEIAIEDGETLMQAATTNDVPGIIGECGGSMMCATCHCHVDADWTERVGAPGEGEREMLECTTSPATPTSRLACQITMHAGLDGLVVYLPESQI